jgi:hypothetical protein
LNPFAIIKKCRSKQPLSKDFKNFDAIEPNEMRPPNSPEKWFKMRLSACMSGSRCGKRHTFSMSFRRGWAARGLAASPRILLHLPAFAAAAAIALRLQSPPLAPILQSLTPARSK